MSRPRSRLQSRTDALHRRDDGNTPSPAAARWKSAAAFANGVSGNIYITSVVCGANKKISAMGVLRDAVTIRRTQFDQHKSALWILPMSVASAVGSWSEGQGAPATGLHGSCGERTIAGEVRFAKSPILSVADGPFYSAGPKQTMALC